ncbi:MAG: phenylacetate--CoA ligase family protein [Chloroflexi bacterium]|nr:phenylacetate--CoA ligase family protein [Chloroflexota bacterium]
MTVQAIVPEVETAPRETLQQIQLAKLRQLCDAVLASNHFYQRKLAGAGLRAGGDMRSLDDLRRLPFTTKSELVADQEAHPPFGTNLTYPLDRYVKFHQTSGTTGRSLRWLDTDESWEWWLNCWGAVYRAAGVGAGDRAYFAFGFGPFIGFWSAYESARRAGLMSIPGGGLTSEQRLQAIIENRATVLVCTPTYALHLAEVARRDGVDLSQSAMRVTIHAGEPGASIPGTRQRIEEAWHAQCFDHTGATEVGATGFSCAARSGVHLNEGEFIFEVIDPQTERPAEEGELVVTNLGRLGMPLIRYRTGDRVRLDDARCECGRTFARMAGGIIGRADDMVTVRGVNVFPSAIENLVREFEAITEFNIEVTREGELDEMAINVEVAYGDGASVAQALASRVQQSLYLRPRVQVVETGTLPRFQLKARRLFDRRKSGS